MKIAFIVDTFPAMSETFILNQITGLMDMGHEVDIYARESSGQKEIHTVVNKYALLDKTIFFRISPNKFLRLISGLFLFFKYFIHNPKALLKSLNIFKYKHDAVSLILLHAVIPFLEQSEYDIIHGHFGRNGLLAVYLKDIGVLNGKTVTTFYGYDASALIRKHGGGYYNKLFKEGDYFTYISEIIKKRITLLGCPTNKMIKIPMGIDLNKYKYTENRFSDNKEIKILSVGRLVGMKGRTYAIKAVSNLINKYPHILYNIVGDGLLKNELTKLIADLNADKYIKILGWVGDDELQKLYNESHIFLHPSVVADDGNAEGQGVVLQEAQASGMVVVATKHSAFPEGVLDGKSGFLVPERDVDALTEKLDILIQNPKLLNEMGKAGHEFVQANYNIKLLNNKLADLYKSLL